MECTGERFLPDYPGDWTPEHFHRYLLARDLVKGKNILDIASGEGYGSALMAEQASSVIGVDISEEAVSLAKEKYRRENLEYRVGRASAIPVDSASIDAVISFETIEHLTEQETMLEEIKRVLRPGGFLIISSPDKEEYSDIPGYANEYHVKELYKEDFQDLITRHFKHADFYGQRVELGSIIAKKKGASFISFERNGDSFTKTDGLSHALYWIAIASDTNIPNIDNSILKHSIELSNAVLTREGEIKNLTEDVSNKTAYLDEVKKALLETQDVLNKTQQALDSLVNDFRTSQNAYKENQQALEEQLQKQIHITEKVTEEKNTLQEQYLIYKGKFEQIINSRSWKLTKPLRDISNLIK